MASIEDITVTIEPKVNVTIDMAVLCAKLLEIWANADSKHTITVYHYNHGYGKNTTIIAIDEGR